MSKNLRMKALAFGSMFSLAVSGIAALPAAADANGPLTLLPDGGTATGATYTSLIGAGITLSSVLDADKQKEAYTQNVSIVENVDGNVSGSFTVPAVDPLARSYYLIENPAGAEITLGLYGDVEDTRNYYVYDADGNSAAKTADFGVTDFYSQDDNEGSYVAIVTTATKIAVKAGDDDTAGDRDIVPLFIDADSTSAVTLKVTSWTDTVVEDGKIGNGEYRSKTQEVKLLPASSVPVTTTMSTPVTKTGQVDGINVRNDSGIRATIAFGSGVNPHAVVASGNLAAVFYEDGSLLNIDEDDTSSGPQGVVSGGAEFEYADVNSTTGVITVSADKQVTTAGPTHTNTDLASAVYAARAVFLAPTPDIFLGARSQVLDLRSGTNATVTGAKAVFAETTNVAVDTNNDVTVRSGTKTLPVSGQILSADGDYKSAGVRVRATVTGVTVDAASEITVTGSTSKIVEDGDSIVVFGFTDSNGRFPITINSTTGEDTDSVSVKFEALNNAGLFVIGAGATETITWADAALQSALEISPSEFLTGETINVTFTAVDQFGVGIDQTATGRVSIRVDAYINGVKKTTTYSETKATTSGAASFSFKNFATAGTDSQIEVTVFQASTPGNAAYYTVYNNVATSSIAVADVFSNRVQYVDYVVGKTSDAAVAKAATDAGVIAEFTAGVAGTDFANIVGTVLDANNAGQPGQPVTIAAAGVLFHDLETKTIAKDSITVFSNGQGYFDVQALSQKVNAAGATVTITAGGKSATTKLRTFLPTTIEAKNLKFSWALPAQMVKNTTYSVVATLTDVWGNPLQTLKLAAVNGNGGQNNDAVTFRADGSIQVNGVASVARNFNATGQATVFVRSVTDIAGPGQFSAVLANLNYYTGGASSETGAVTTVASIYTDTTTTTWNEASWSDTLSVVVDVLDRAPVTGKVNVGSFNGKLVVYASGLNGARISWKVGGNWGSAVATSNYSIFDRPTPRAGVTVSVEVFVNGVKQLTKSVVTR